MVGGQRFNLARSAIDVLTPQTLCVDAFGNEAVPPLDTPRFAAIEFSVDDIARVAAKLDQSGIASRATRRIGGRTGSRRHGSDDWVFDQRIASNMSDTITPNAHVSVGNVTFGADLPIAVFAGPCQMESREHAIDMATALKEICDRLGIGLVYKSSFDKANRTSLNGKRGLGLEKALPVFAEIRETLGTADCHGCA